VVQQRLFISHASEDAATVESIVTNLEAHGVPCWIASRDIPPRSIYAEEITKGIEESEACAVIVSEAANRSGAIKRELELASHHNKAFIPIRIDNSEPGRGLDYYLRNTQWIDYRRERERGLDRIVAHLRGEGGGASAPPIASAPIAAPSVPDAPTNMTPWMLLPIAAVGIILAWVAMPRNDALNESTDIAASAVETATPATEEEVAAIHEVAQSLVGRYRDANRNGSCEGGPTVALDGVLLVFNVPGVGTQRHHMIEARAGSSDQSMTTRVFEPATEAGREYLIYLVGNRVSVAEKPNDPITAPSELYAWEKCVS
jgi:hypothetical protein